MTSKLAWVLIAALLAFVLWWLGPVDWAGAQSLRDIVRESEGGQMPSREEFKRRGGDAPADDEVHMRESEVPAQPPDAVGPPRAPDAGDSGRVLVPAEPGPLLSAWGFMAWLPDGRLIPRAGWIYEDADLCTRARAAQQQQAPQLRFSACTLLQVGEPERL